MEMQMITLRYDVRDPQLAITWSRSVALFPFWCLAAKGGESVGICVAELLVCRLVVLCFLVYSLGVFVWFGLVPVRPKF